MMPTDGHYQQVEHALIASLIPSSSGRIDVRIVDYSTSICVSCGRMLGVSKIGGRGAAGIKQTLGTASPAFSRATIIQSLITHVHLC
jgi:hypothetical protein